MEEHFTSHDVTEALRTAIVVENYSPLSIYWAHDLLDTKHPSPRGKHRDSA